MATTRPPAAVASRDLATTVGGSAHGQRTRTLIGIPKPARVPEFDEEATPSLKAAGLNRQGSGSSTPPGGADPRALKREVRRLSGQVETLQVQKLFLANILEATSDAMIVAEYGGAITIFNGGAAELFGISAEEAVGDSLFRLLEQAMADDAGSEASKMLMTENRVVNFRCEVIDTSMGRTPVLLTLNFVPTGEQPAIVAVLKDNSEVEKLTRTDPLTCVSNRREFDRRISDEYGRLKRGHVSALSLILLDVDKFRDFNTKYGHQIGDEVLRKVGSILRDCVREIDTAARYGGEEFAVILPGTEEAGAFVVAERIRTSLEAVVIHTEQFGDLTVTASLGVSTHRPSGAGTNQLVEQADRALYAAKNGGRNRSRRYSQPPKK